MIKTFEHTINGQPTPFCVALAEGPDGARAVISTADSAKTLVVMDILGVIGSIKTALESTDDFLDRAARKAADEGLIDRAISTGEPQQGAI
jgi:hypothetical protein